AIQECADAGAQTVIVGASGFAETGTAGGIERQAALTALARSRGMRVLGPNTNGIINNAHDLYLGYNSEHQQRIPAGNVSLVSHSGAMFTGFARSLQKFGAGLSKFVAVGNESDVTMLDMLAFLIADETTHVIALLIEGLSDGPRLRMLARQAAA